MASACKKPLPNGGGCGQCDYCRINRKMDRVNLLKLEFRKRPYAYFVTLTYDDICLPVFKNGLATLWYEDLKSYCNRIRSSFSYQTGSELKIFAVGEYGGYLFGNEDASRPIHPHYHLAIFSSNPLLAKTARKLFESRWRYGHVHVLLLSSGLIDYISGYISKKLTNKDSMKKIMNLDIAPEFSFGRGLGDVSEELLAFQEQYGRPDKIRVDGKLVVTPKYLRDKVKRKFLEFGLEDDLNKCRRCKKCYACIELQERRERAKEESEEEMQMRRLQKDQEAKLAAGTNDVYKARQIVRDRAIAEFDMKMELKKSTKRKKVL